MSRLRSLVFTRTSGYRHSSIPVAVRALQVMDDLDVHHSERAADVEKCHDYDVVIFLSTIGEILEDAGRASLRAYVEGGGAFVGIHAASATEENWDWYGELIGARFAGHPPGVQRAAVIVHDADHASGEPLPNPWTWTEEWYAFSQVREDSRFLLSVDEASYVPGAFTMPGKHVQSWCRDVGVGRSWYTALGHRNEAWSDEAFLAHVRGGIASAARH